MSSFAAVHKWTDESGNTIFGDTPPDDVQSEIINVPPSNTYKAPEKAHTRQNTSRNSPRQASSQYSILAISSPENDQSIRSNGGEVNISVEISPELNLDEGHQLRISLDDNEASLSQSTSTTLQEVSRGSHTLQVEIVDQHDNTLQSSPVTEFHLHRHSIIR